jgi:hypothetical protein
VTCGRTMVTAAVMWARVTQECCCWCHLCGSWLSIHFPRSCPAGAGSPPKPNVRATVASPHSANPAGALTTVGAPHSANPAGALTTVGAPHSANPAGAHPCALYWPSHAVAGPCPLFPTTAHLHAGLIAAIFHEFLHTVTPPSVLDLSAQRRLQG